MLSMLPGLVRFNCKAKARRRQLSSEKFRVDKQFLTWFWNRLTEALNTDSVALARFLNSMLAAHDAQRNGPEARVVHLLKVHSICKSLIVFKNQSRSPLVISRVTRVPANSNLLHGRQVALHDSANTLLVE